MIALLVLVMSYRPHIQPQTILEVSVTVGSLYNTLQSPSQVKDIFNEYTPHR